MSKAFLLLAADSTSGSRPPGGVFPHGKHNQRRLAMNDMSGRYFLMVRIKQQLEKLEPIELAIVLSWLASGDLYKWGADKLSANRQDTEGITKEAIKKLET